MLVARHPPGGPLRAPGVKPDRRAPTLDHRYRLLRETRTTPLRTPDSEQRTVSDRVD